MTLTVLTDNIDTTTANNYMSKLIMRYKCIISKLEYNIVKTNKIVSSKFLKTVHTPEYIHFLQNVYDYWIKTGKNNVFLENPLQSPSNEDNGLIPLIHHNVFNKNMPLLNQIGYFATDNFTRICSDTYTLASKCSSLGVYASALLKDVDTVYCLNFYPGNHVTGDKYGGYCFLNNAAICAKSVVKYCESRVVILDLDYNHGNGTQDIFYDSKDVLTVSIHIDPNLDFPFVFGFENETGIGLGQGYNFNIPLPRGTTWPVYEKGLTRAISIIEKFNPDLLIISFGANTYKGDLSTSSLGRFKLELDDYFQMGQMVADMNLKTIILQEGGYNKQYTGVVISNFLQPFNKRNLNITK